MGTFEFHVSRQMRDQYNFDQELFSLTGNVVFANFRAVRDFTYKINAKRDLIRYPEQAAKAGEINAMGLIDEILHYVIMQYRRQANPQVMEQALAILRKTICAAENELDCPAFELALNRFAHQFPPLRVYRHEITLEEYLQGETDGIPNRQILLEEMLMLWLANVNPAFSPYLDLFDDDALRRETCYGDKKPSHILPILYKFFETQPKFGPDNQNLIDMLRAPALASPHSLTGQLEYMLRKWTEILGGRYLYRLLGGLDLIKEETKIVFGVGDGGVSQVYEFGGLEKEPERFSPDSHWMPSLVMIAKHTYVWLDQLSKKYEHEITRLDQIPDAELDQLVRWGFTGLWLIGVWERSSASRKIKQWTGNPEAAASAYSLYDYQIAGDLGGDEAYFNLKQRAWERGIRLGADMVPNHMGIYSKWVVEHPDWFVSLPYSPFPSYSFNTGNLSESDHVGVYLEEHYYSRTDAAVVFKRIDHRNGSETYIYHGNDGTSMPWNDTAQLNYLNPEVREAVIQTILHVARRFPIIRFDAAMTLTKLHYQRLWFPEPGTGGAIASRAEFGLTKAQINQAMPEEFWREVVDRVAQEAPDTLLLAEAFWLLEGYFVRTLGMHRVYNSAFMNMLRDEKNNEYRQVIKNTLEFDPEILKRYVNFMNNPDERTAVEQFGKGDKYFGIALMLSTMPGLPMFGHGQVEGLAEKYGMEYRRAYWNEDVDPYLVDRHQKELAPLMHQRYLFAEVDNFLLYDFFVPGGNVDENVFAYSNLSGDQRVLVIYHNKFADTRGWIRSSVAYSVKTGNNDDRKLIQRSLAEGLGLRNDANWFTIFRDHKSGLEFIRNNRLIFEQGLYIELGAYQYNVFIDFRQVPDDEWRHYSHLESYLGGRGVPNIEDAMTELFLQPIHHPYKEFVNAGQFQWLIDNHINTPTAIDKRELKLILDEVETKLKDLLVEIKRYTQGEGNPVVISHSLRFKTEAILYLPSLLERYDLYLTEEIITGIQSRFFEADDKANLFYYGTLFSWIATHSLGKALSDESYALQSRAWLDEWLLNKLILGALESLGLKDQESRQAVVINNLLVTFQDWFTIQSGKESLDGGNAYKLLSRWLENSEVQHFLQINRQKGILWFNKEAFEQFLWWMNVIAVIQILTEDNITGDQITTSLKNCNQLIQQFLEAERGSGYQVEKLLELVHAN